MENIHLWEVYSRKKFSCNIQQLGGRIYLNSKNVKIGNYYRLKNSIDYGWVKVLEVKKPKEDWNNTNYITAKCEHSVHKNDTMGFIRYFKLSDLIEERS